MQASGVSFSHLSRTGSFLILGVDKELAKRQIQEANRRVLIIRNTKNRVQRVKSTLDLLL
jgi:hypothetical protein